MARQQIQRWTLLSAPECHIRVRHRLSWDSLSEINWPVFNTAGTAMNRKWGNKEFGSSCKVTRVIFKYQNVSHVLESIYSVSRVVLVASVVFSLLECTKPHFTIFISKGWWCLYHFKLFLLWDTGWGTWMESCSLHCFQSFIFNMMHLTTALQHFQSGFLVLVFHYFNMHHLDLCWNTV